MKQLPPSISLVNASSFPLPFVFFDFSCCWGHFWEVAVLLKISISEERCGRIRNGRLALSHSSITFWFCIFFIRTEGTLLRDHRTYWDFKVLDAIKKYFLIISAISRTQTQFSYIKMHRLSSSTTLLLTKFRLMRNLKSHCLPQNLKENREETNSELWERVN